MKLGGVDVESLPWITVVPDSGGNPAQVVVSTNDPAYVGYYSLSITSLLNTTPVEVSADEYQFIVNIQSSEPCATIEFERQDLQLAFEIAPAATPATLSFDEFSYQASLACGAQYYEAVVDYPGVVWDLSSRQISFETTDIADMGTIEVIFLVYLENYEYLNPYIYIDQSVFIHVTSACTNAVIIDESP